MCFVSIFSFLSKPFTLACYRLTVRGLVFIISLFCEHRKFREFFFNTFGSIAFNLRNPSEACTTKQDLGLSEVTSGLTQRVTVIKVWYIAMVTHAADLTCSGGGHVHDEICQTSVRGL